MIGIRSKALTVGFFVETEDVINKIKQTKQLRKVFRWNGRLNEENVGT